MSRTAITQKFKMLWFPNEARYWALKLQMDTNLPPLMPDEDKNFRGSLVLDFRKWWRHVKMIHRHQKNSCRFNGIGTHDLCDAGAMLYPLSYEATQLGTGEFVGLTCSCLKDWWIINIKVPLTPKYFFAKMNLCTCLKRIAAIFFIFLTNPAIL